MLEKLPNVVGHMLRSVHPDTHNLFINDDCFADVPMSLDVRSPAFEAGDTIPRHYTADGEKVSPPIAWLHVPNDTESIALVIEDADSPSPEPFVHALVWNLEGRDGLLAEGVLPNDDDVPGWTPMGLNSFLQAQYLPPDPPPGHGRHRYAFQVFALDRPLELPHGSGRTKLMDALRDHVIAKGCLVGTYERADA